MTHQPVLAVLAACGTGGYHRPFTPGPRPNDQFFLFTSGHLSQPSRDLAVAYDLQVVDTLAPHAFQQAIDVMTRRLQRAAVHARPGPPTAPTVHWRWRKFSDGRLVLQVRPIRRITAGGRR